jgi:hypothetical protein
VTGGDHDLRFWPLASRREIFSRAFKRAFGVAPGVYRRQDQRPVALEQFRPARRLDV